MTISVSNWTTDPVIGLSSVYLPVGVDNLCYDVIRQPVQNRLYFAGEVSKADLRTFCDQKFCKSLRIKIPEAC